MENLDVEVRTPVYTLPASHRIAGETLHYSLSWVGVPLGGVAVEMAPSADRGGLAVAIRGATVPGIEWLYSLRFSAEGLVRTEPFAPGGLTLEACENSRTKRTRILFPDGEGPIRAIREKRGRIKEYFFHSDNSYDVPSAVYLMLHLDYAEGQRYELDAFTGESRYLVTADVVGRETIEVRGAPTDAWHLRLHTRDLTDPEAQQKHRGTSVWVSAEAPRRLLRAQTDTFVGAVTLELLPARTARNIDASCPSSA